MDNKNDILKDPHCGKTMRVNNTRQSKTGMYHTLNTGVDKSIYLPYSLSVTGQMISDFETSTGLLGIGKKMVAAGFWRLS